MVSDSVLVHRVPNREVSDTCENLHELFGLERHGTLLLLPFLTEAGLPHSISAGSQVLTDLFVALTGAVQKCCRLVQHADVSCSRPEASKVAKSIHSLHMLA